MKEEISKSNKIDNKHVLGNKRQKEQERKKQQRQERRKERNKEKAGETRNIGKGHEKIREKKRITK